MDEYLELRRMNKLYKEGREKKLEESAAANLAENIETKLKTSFIGAIAQFEQTFGYLWGEGKNEPTENQLKFKKLWKEVRTRILNNGNNQIRAINNELRQYNVKWVGFRNTFKGMGNEG